jgi:hypothetical protein
MKYYLVTESGNYADEFNLEAMRLFEAESEKDLQNKILENLSDQIEDSEGEYSEEDKHLAWPMEFYFGTNEAITYNSKEAILEDLTITEVSLEDYKVIEKLLGTSFGTGAIL